MLLPTSTFGFIRHFVRQQWFKFGLFFITSIIWAVNDTFFPYFLKQIVDKLAAFNGPMDQVYGILASTLVLLATFWLISEMMQRLQGVMQIYTFPHFRANIRQSVFDYVKSHSQEYFANHLAGNMAKRLADLPNSCQSIMEIICFQFATAIAGTLIVLVMMWRINPIFAGILFVWLCVHIGLSIVFLRSCNELWETHSDSVSVLSGKIVDVFSNILNVRLFARSKHESDYLKKYQRDEIKKAKKAMWAMEFIRIGLGLDGLFLILGMVYTLIYGWTQHWVTLGDFTQIGMQSFWLLGWIWFISYQLTLFARELGTITNALSLVRKGHDIVDAPAAKPLQIIHGQIEFDKVTFTYNRRRVIFKNLSMLIPAGQKIGLVGFSGSGKSTFVNLILRFYDIQSGRIVIDGQNIAEITQASLRSQIAMIPQDPALFHRSVMENIRYGRLEATDEEVYEAARLAHCHEFIEVLDSGYHSLVGERGVKLSGGQRQRIAIARAILKNAPILILDEATSSLDSVTEKLIQDSLQHLMRGRTTIVVAHRLSTLTDMDRILVFHKGAIAEDGTKNALLKEKGHFAMLWSMQTDGFLPQAE